MLAKVFGKGQIVIPVMLRKKLNIKIGDKVNIMEEEDGVKIIPIKQSEPIINLAGIFSKYAIQRINDNQISKITESELIKSYQNEIY